MIRAAAGGQSMEVPPAPTAIVIVNAERGSQTIDVP